MNKNSFLKKLGENIRTMRNRKKLSQEELANISDLDRTYIGGIERGERNISIMKLKKLSDALEVEMQDLL